MDFDTDCHVLINLSLFKETNLKTRRLHTDHKHAGVVARLRQMLSMMVKKPSRHRRVRYREIVPC